MQLCLPIDAVNALTLASYYLLNPHIQSTLCLVIGTILAALWFRCLLVQIG